MSGTNISKLTEMTRKITKFIRPPGPPKIWEVVEKIGRDGRPIKFTIQEIPEDRSEDAIDHMCQYFMVDEPTCACFNAVNSPIFVKECREFWRNILDQGIAVAAFVDNPNGNKSIIAGLNMLCVEYKDEKIDIQLQSNFRFIFNAMKKLNKSLRLFERYNVDKYMFAVGLSVATAYRGYGLGADILKVRDKIGQEYDIEMTSTAFTSPFAAKAAERVGFEILLKTKFADFVDENGKECFPGIQKYSDTLVIMAKRIK
ncbi:PREDICTED: uncharacterized protein LOC106746984 [Dinoponera quadriceps]|uniref:Uncharacterized protein LOC106746984 n=1 Tax=Dinoponera quadriceps TaxID=609295 RepID=A0A6P3XMJ1_DINQU|nr:PREDICTED: uncharacterized protein LOC106746984 [Dinoponera quadriceps]